MPWRRRATMGGVTLDPQQQKVLEKVRALLAKAESTTFGPEAEQCTAKAQELLSRHRLEGLELGVDAGTGAGPGRRRFVIEAPYVRPKFHLLTGIARANHCETVLHTATDEATIVGYGSDVDAVLVLYTSLLVQGTAAMLAEGSAADRAGRSRTRSFRHAFWLSFGQRIGERLRAATATAEASAATATPGVLPVLARRDALVAEELRNAFGPLRSIRASVSNAAGIDAGRRAAERADLGDRQPLDP